MNDFYNEYSIKQIKRSERHNIFLRSNYVGVAFLIQILGSAALVYGAVALISLVQGISYLDAAELVTNDVIIGYGLNSLLSFIFFVPIFMLVPMMSGQKAHSITALNAPSRKDLVIPGIGLSFLIMLAATFFTDYVDAFFTKFFGVEPVMPEIAETSNMTLFESIFLFICVTFVPAFCEEFALRGVVLGTMKKYGDLEAILFSSLLFSLMHGNLVQIPYTFCFGLGLGILRVSTGSLWPCIFVHFFNNAIASLDYYLPSNVMYITNVIIYIALGIFGVIGLILFIRRRGFNELKRVPSTMNGFSRFIRMILSPTVIIFIIISLFTASQYLSQV